MFIFEYLQAKSITVQFVKQWCLLDIQPIKCDHSQRWSVNVITTCHLCD